MPVRTMASDFQVSQISRCLPLADSEYLLLPVSPLAPCLPCTMPQWVPKDMLLHKDSTGLCDCRQSESAMLAECIIRSQPFGGIHSRALFLQVKQ